MHLQIALLVLALLGADARTVTVTFGADEAKGQATLVFRSEDNASLDAITREVAVLSEPAAVQLPPGVWSLDVESDQHWHPRQHILPSETTITAALHPRSRITGKLSSDAKLPERVRLHLDDHAIDCPIDEESFDCAVPAGTFDIRVTAPGFISQIRSAATLPRGRALDLGPLRLRRGHSIHARVTAPKGTDQSKIRVLAEPKHGGRGLQAPVDRRGNAQIDGVAPGAYFVQATHPTGLASERVAVVVIEGAETALPQTLSLERPRTISVQILPPLPPGGGAWAVSLTRPRGIAHQIETIAETAASPDGEWKSPPLQPDQYDLAVTSRTGDVWHRETIALHGGDEHRAVVLTPRRITGQVRLGGEPLQAGLEFATESARTVNTRSDADGKFEALLPDPSETSWRVHVLADQIGLRRTLTVTIDSDDVTIDLPSWTVSGTVLDADGRPVERAIVTVTGDAEMPFVQAESAADGSFTVAAVPDGAYQLKATGGPKGDSETITATVDRNDAAPVKLVLRPTKRLRGRIVAAAGPVAGARVHVRPRNVWVPMLHTYTTAEDGTFAAQLPEEVTELDLLVAAPGFAFTSAHVPYRPNMLTITVQQNGGTIELPQGKQAILYHDGAVIDLAGPIAYEWPVARAGASLVLPQMEPGLYRACAGTSCTEGFLAPSATLRLPLP